MGNLGAALLHICKQEQHMQSIQFVKAIPECDHSICVHNKAKL